MQKVTRCREILTNLELDPASAAGARMGDVMPTILDLYRAQPPERLDGKSLLPKQR